MANYEYAIYWNVSVESRDYAAWFLIACAFRFVPLVKFFQDGNVQLEVRLTGILNLALLAPGESTGGFGTEVAPQVRNLMAN